MDSLITGVISKNVMEKSRQTSKMAKRRVQLRKDDLGKLARMMGLSVEVFCEASNDPFQAAICTLITIRFGCRSQVT